MASPDPTGTNPSGSNADDASRRGLTAAVGSQRLLRKSLRCDPSSAFDPSGHPYRGFS